MQRVPRVVADALVREGLAVRVPGKSREICLVADAVHISIPKARTIEEGQIVSAYIYGNQY